MEQKIITSKNKKRKLKQNIKKEKDDDCFLKKKLMINIMKMNNCDYCACEDEIIYNAIQNDYGKMDYFEKKNLVNKCLTELEIDNILLKYEMRCRVKFGTNECKRTRSQFLKECEKIFKRYQRKAGGHLLEDEEWIINVKSNKLCELKQNEIFFENTICVVDSYQKEVNEYLENLMKIINNISTNHIGKLIYKTPNLNSHNSDKIIYVLMKIKEID